MNATQETTPRTETAAPAEREIIRPLVSIYETADAYTLEADMPGVNKEGLEVTLEDNELTLAGHRADFGPKGSEPAYRESAPADYRRSFELAQNINTSQISARIENGVLTVVLPKAEQVKPRRIEVS
jgi:HSP20 family protein